MYRIVDFFHYWRDCVFHFHLIFSINLFKPTDVRYLPIRRQRKKAWTGSQPTLIQRPPSLDEGEWSRLTIPRVRALSNSSPYALPVPSLGPRHSPVEEKIRVKANKSRKRIVRPRVIAAWENDVMLREAQKIWPNEDIFVMDLGDRGANKQCGGRVTRNQFRRGKRGRTRLGRTRRGRTRRGRTRR